MTPKRSQLELSFLYATRLLNVLYILVKNHKNILKGFRVMVRTKFYNFGRLWEITPEPSRLELSFLHATLLPNALYNLTKFHEKSSKGIGVMGRTRFCLQTDGQTDARAIVISPEPIGRGIKRNEIKLKKKKTKKKTLNAANNVCKCILLFPICVRRENGLDWRIYNS